MMEISPTKLITTVTIKDRSIELLTDNGEVITRPFDHITNDEWLSIKEVGHINIWDREDYEPYVNDNDDNGSGGYFCTIYVDSSFYDYYNPKLVHEEYS